MSLMGWSGLGMCRSVVGGGLIAGGTVIEEMGRYCWSRSVCLPLGDDLEVSVSGWQ